MPVLVLAGDSELSKNKRLAEIREKFGGTLIKVHPEDPQKLETISNSLKSVGMFSNKKIIEIVDFDSWKSKEKRALLDILKDVPEEVFVVIRSSKKIKGFDNEDHSLPKPWERDAWIGMVRRELEMKGLKASTEVVEYLLDVVGNDEMRLHNEIEKLYLFKEGEITVSDVDEVVYRYTHPTLDELCFSISEFNFEKAHELVDDVLRSSDPVLVVASLAKHFLDLYRTVITVKHKEKYIWPDVANVSKKLGIPVPKTARFLGFKFKGWNFDVVNHVVSYEPDALENMLKRLYALDRQVKGGGDPRFHIHEFIEGVRGDINVRRDGEVALG